MPGLGKSGMLRIFALSWSMESATGIGGCGGAASGDAEAASAAGGRDGVDRENVDGGPGLALRERALDARHRLDLALDLRLDPAVRHVADEPGHALADRGVLDEVAEADALDAAADEITSGDDHESGAPVRLEPARRTRMVCEGLD